MDSYSIPKTPPAVADMEACPGYHTVKGDTRWMTIGFEIHE
jgi:hypothetical protein